MKKINSILLMAILSLVIFSSCEKETLQNEETFDVQSNRGMDVGTTLEDYPDEMTIENWEQFIYAPQEVIDHHNQIELASIKVSEVTNTENTLAPIAGNVRGFKGNSWEGMYQFKLTRGNCTSFTNFFGNYVINDGCSGALCGSYPNSNNTAINGVSTLDLVKVQRHILGLEPFTDARQEIAADVSRDGIISTFDILEIRKLVLGIYINWPDSDNLVILPLNEYNDAQSLMPGLSQTFLYSYGNFGPCYNATSDSDRRVIKTGDVNGTFSFLGT